MQDILRGFYANLRQRVFYDFDLNASIHHYRTKHGVNVPLVFESKDQLLGIVPCPDAYPPPKTLGSAAAFLKRYGHSSVFIAYRGKDAVMKARGLFLVPYFWLI